MKKLIITFLGAILFGTPFLSHARANAFVNQADDAPVETANAARQTKKSSKKGGQIQDRTKDAVKDSRGFCAVHHVRMRETLLPINYRFVDPPLPGTNLPGYAEAEEKLFPNDITEINGGDVVGKAKRARVLQCPACRRARARWIAAHSK